MSKKDEVIIDFNNIAEIDTNRKWDHNKQYHKFLMKNAPKYCGAALDIGCGSGEFARILAHKSKLVIGIDLSPEMVKLAEQSTQHNIHFIVQDILKYDAENEYFDCIVSIATIHHIHFESVIQKIKKWLSVGGVLMILDIYKCESLLDYLYAAIACPVNIIFNIVKNKQLRKSRAERQIWNEHIKHDKFMTLSEITRITQKELPGAKIKQHLFWRYSLIWTKR